MHGWIGKTHEQHFQCAYQTAKAMYMQLASHPSQSACATQLKAQCSLTMILLVEFHQFCCLTELFWEERHGHTSITKTYFIRHVVSQVGPMDYLQPLCAAEPHLSSRCSSGAVVVGRALGTHCRLVGWQVLAVEVKHDCCHLINMARLAGPK